MEKFKGIFPALLTPFDENNRLNEKALEQLIEMNLKKGVRGFYVGGSTGEAFLLSESERKQLYRAAAQIADGRCTLIAHIGAISTDQAAEFGKTALECGYDAISSVSPFYYSFTFPEIKRYYFDIVNRVDLPMIIYNIPKYSGVTLSAENIGEFLEDDRFIGVKHTSNDYFAMEQFKSAYPGKVVFNGFDEMFLAGLAMGADGGIGSTYNFMAEKFVKMYALVKEGRISDAQPIQREVNRIIAALMKVGVLKAEKAIMKMMGIDCGTLRKPFAALSKEEEDYVYKTVQNLL